MARQGIYWPNFTLPQPVPLGRTAPAVFVAIAAASSQRASARGRSTWTKPIRCDDGPNQTVALRAALVPIEIRPDIGTAFAVGGAGELVFEIGQPYIVRPSSKAEVLMSS